MKVDGAAFAACRGRWSATARARWDALVDFATEAARPSLAKVRAKAAESVRTVVVQELDCGIEGGRAAAEKKLHEWCAEFGEVAACKVLHEQGRAFVTFASHEEAARCIVGLFRRQFNPASGRIPYYTWARR